MSAGQRFKEVGRDLPMETQQDWPVELIASTLSDLIPKSKVALIRLSGSVENIGDVMDALILADKLTRAMACRNKSDANTPERSRDS